ncbi:MAG: hypothetical protein HPY59_07950 [Anaerolineae bacterium]|nr:hypothetical protein [Anaerolineae bacterium]
MDEALYAHIMGGAYADFSEKKKGSLEASTFAGLIVWHDDPHSAATADIPKLKIDLTMVGGKVVHEA